jgi:hypothetical protein
MNYPRNEGEVHAISSSTLGVEAFRLQPSTPGMAAGHGSAGWQWTLCGVCLSRTGPGHLWSSLWICGPCPSILNSTTKFAIIRTGTARTSTQALNVNWSSRVRKYVSRRQRLQGISTQHAMLIAIVASLLGFSQFPVFQNGYPSRHHQNLAWREMYISHLRSGSAKPQSHACKLQLLTGHSTWLFRSRKIHTDFCSSSRRAYLSLLSIANLQTSKDDMSPCWTMVWVHP